MKVEEAFKYIVSCGVIMTPFNSITPDQAHQRSDQKEPEVLDPV